MRPRDAFVKGREAAHKEFKEAVSDFSTNLGYSAEITRIVNETPNIIDNLDEKFREITKLTKNDVKILFVAIGLQLLRQYFQEKLYFPKVRPSDQEAAGQHDYSSDERSRAYYNPTFDEIVNKPVPFDVMEGSKGKLAGGGYFGHRGKTVGHDPLLGLIIGTANIATATVTIAEGFFKYKSYHVKTNERNHDSFSERASTAKALYHTVEKVVKNPKGKDGRTGREKVIAALAKEIIHLASDINSKRSLPLPVITTVSPELASELANYGIDCANIIYMADQVRIISKQASYAVFINFIISIFHRLFYDGKTDETQYKVRTRKIIMYSNMVASAVNLGICGFAAYKEDYVTAYRSLDLGGHIVTVYRLITDKKFINKVREEFIMGAFKSEINNIMNGIEREQNRKLKRELFSNVISL